MPQVGLFLLYLSSYFGLSYCSERVPNIDLRIAGGTAADIADFPYQVSLHVLENEASISDCSATIISTDWAVTAAHCVYGYDSPEVRLHSGSSFKYNEEGTMHTVEQITIHPNYTRNYTNFDLAVIKVANPFQFSDVVQPIRMASQKPTVRTKAIIAGWGIMADGGPTSDQLQKIEVSIIGKQKCKRLLIGPPRRILQNIICATASGCCIGTCEGDSGSPLVANGELVGIESWSPKLPCGYNTTAYVNVAQFRPWVTSITGVN